MAESYSVTAVLSAQDKNFSKTFGSASSAADSLTKKLTSGLGFGVLVGVGQKAFSSLTSSLSGFTGELESTSAAWQTFEKNATMNGHTAKEIASTKKELQSFAQQTIYSASDMATTYAQLDAVGIKSADSLVKGFGGIASAAENPSQAMKTLSQQGVQMAAKPTVAWQDFKLMLEQTPAGIAAVASEMGMSTSEMVAAVQSGEIATNDFFEAVQKVGTSDAFTEMATTYKTTGQAMDGLAETVTNKLMPAFSVLQKKGIKAVEGIISKVEEFDGQKIADTITRISDAFESGGIAGAIGEVKGLLDELPESVKAVGAALGAFSAVSLANSVLNSETWNKGVAGVKNFGATLSSVAKTAPPEMARMLGNLSNGFVNLIPPGIVSKVGGSMQKIGSEIKLMGYIGKMTGENLWSNFISDTALGKVVSKVGGFVGKVGSVLGQVGGVVLQVGGQLAGGLQTMMGVAMQALLPAALIGAALAGLGVLYDRFGEQIDSMLAMATEKGPQVIQNFTQGITSRIPNLISKGSEMVSKLLTTIGTLAPSLISSGAQIVVSLVQGVAQNAPMLISSAITAVGGFASGILNAIPSLLTAGMQLLLGLAQGVSANLPRMAQGAMSAIQSFIGGLSANFPTILSTAGQIVTTLISGITSALPSLVSGAVGVIGTLAQGFISNLPQIIQTGVQVVASLALGIISGIGSLIGAIPQVFGMVVDTIMSTNWLQVGIDIVTAIGDGIVGAIGGIGGKVGELLGGIGDWITGGNKAGTDYANAASQSITTSAPTITTAAQNAATTVTDGSVDAFLTGGTTGGESLMNGITGGITAGMPMLTQSATTAVTSATDILADSSIQSDADTAGQELVESAASGIDSGAMAAETAVQSTMTNALSAVSTSAVEAQASGEEMGNAIITGFTTGIEPLAEAASASVQTAVTAMQDGLSAMQSAGQQAGQRFAQGIKVGLTQASTAAKTSVRALVSALKSAVSPAQAAGRQVGTRFATGVKAGTSASRSAGLNIGKASVTGMKSVASSAKSAGASVGSKFASGVSSKSSTARSAGKSLANAAKSGMSGVSTTSIGSYMGQGLVNGLNSKYGAVASAAARLANKAAEAMRNASKVASPSRVTKKIGFYIGEGLRLGIQNSTTAVERTSAAFMNSALQAMRDAAGVASPSKETYAIAGFCTAGLDNGIKAGVVKIIGTVTTATKQVTKVVDTWGKNKFLKSALDTIKTWGTTAASYIRGAASTMKNAFGTTMKDVASSVANGFSSTLQAKSKTISDSATGIITSATNSMVTTAKSQQSRYQKAYEYNLKMQKKYEKIATSSKSSAKEKAAAKKKAKQYAAYAAQHKATAEKHKALATSYTNAGNAMKTAFSTAFSNAVTNAINSTTSAINALGEAYQAQYDAIIKARESFRDKMREINLGEYDDEKRVVTSLTDYNVAKRQIEQYGANLEKLKGILPEGMMSEILAMDAEEGLAYTEKLLSNSEAWLKMYGQSYSNYMAATEKVSSQYYQSSLNTLQSQYTSAVESEFSKLQTSLQTIGQQAMQGFVDGMNAKKTSLDSAAVSLVNSVINTIKTNLQIHSPSRVMRQLGAYTGEGFVEGIEGQVNAARNAVRNLVDTTQPQLSIAAGAESMHLSDEYNYNSNNKYHFEFVSEIDGRQVAKSTAEYNEVELERLRRRDERRKGRR